MNILGQPFADFVRNQINVRQASLGDSYQITNDNLLYQNTKTPWIRLASTVNINKAEDGNGVLSKLKSFGLSESDIMDSNLARNLILQGGTAFLEDGVDGAGKLNSGLNYTNSQFGGAYGWGGINDTSTLGATRGYVPMPGITDATVQYYNNGALSKATINMKCFSRNQLAMLDALYMRPGYNLLLEFGWSTYLNNEGVLTSYDNFYSDALSFVFNPKPTSSGDPTHFDVLDLIQKERIARCGNYEGVFGKVTNFNWSFNPDGSYNCTTMITGMGDMMESLKVNIKLPTKNDDDQEQTSTVAEATTDPPLIANKNKTTLNKVLYGLFEQVKDGIDSDDTYYTVTLPSCPLTPVTITAGDEKQTSKFEKKELKIKSGMLAMYLVTTDAAEGSETETSMSGPQVYLTFGTLLALIQKYLLIYDTNGCPLFDFDVDFENIEEDKNYIVKLPGQFSSDPLQCLIPYTSPLPDTVGDITYPDTSVNETLTKKSANWNYNTYLGRLMHVYLNMGNIATILEATPRDEDGVLSLLSFLNAVIDSITGPLGGINMISIKVDEVTGKIKFIENSPQRFDEEPSDQTFARINTFGVKPDVEGSFVRNITMNGELGPKFASMIAIGAQISGNKLSANATGFSNYNKGLEDRVIPTKINADDLDQGTEEEAEKVEIETVEDAWKKQINLPAEGGAASVFESIYQQRRWLLEDIGILSELNYNYMSMMSGRLVEDKQLQSPTFLPFNLSMDCDGISGMKLFEKFLIDDRVLPPSYVEGSVDLLVKALNHNITPNNWLTTIDTQCAPHSPMSPIKSPRPLSSSTVAQASAGGGGGGSSQPVGSIGDFKSLTSGFPMAKIFYDGPTQKKQIYIHHTAGATKSPSRTIAGWSKRTDHVATHYITNNLGDKEQLFADEAWANHLGIKGSVFRKAGLKYQNLNKVSLGIEMQSYGWCDFKNGKYINAYKGSIPANEVGRPVDANGNFISYKGHKYYQKYNAANIAHVKTIVTGWMNKYNIPFVYNYSELFPNSGQAISKNALAGKPGVYTHNSVRTGKSDVWPQAELIAMLKSISS